MKRLTVSRLRKAVKSRVEVGFSASEAVDDVFFEVVKIIDELTAENARLRKSELTQGDRHETNHRRANLPSRDNF